MFKTSIFEPDITITPSRTIKHYITECEFQLAELKVKLTIREKLLLNLISVRLKSSLVQTCLAVGAYVLQTYSKLFLGLCFAGVKYSEIYNLYSCVDYIHACGKKNENVDLYFHTSFETARLFP